MYSNVSKFEITHFQDKIKPTEMVLHAYRETERKKLETVVDVNTV